MIDPNARSLEPSLLEVRELSRHFMIKGQGLSRKAAVLKAVDRVSFTLERGQTLGLVGESGCGKSTLARTIVRLIEPTEGQILLKGNDLASAGSRELKLARRHMQMIFQDPYASLSPRRTVMQTLREPLDVHRIGPAAGRGDRVRDLLETVGLGPGTLNRFPHEFSGGQRQRIAIARALATRPELIIADEAVSALDVSIQAQVLNLIADLQDAYGIAFLFISHDLAVVRHISHRVAVMYRGEIVESAATVDLFAEPLHPYTHALLQSAPGREPRGKKHTSIKLPGEVSSPTAPTSGCAFHPLCPQAMAICRHQRPAPVAIQGAGQRTVSCHLHESGGPGPK
ncbi:MAG: ABC transporter ATP-binding protein [Wenzhouxiangella sp.]